MNDVRLVATNPVDSSLVPVATNSRGELAVQSPKIEKVPNDLDVEGDLTVTGTATIAGDATINTLTVGMGSGSESSNTVVGIKSLQNNTTGTQNTAIGNSVLFSNTEGGNNTAIGPGSLYNNTTGSANTAIGRNALRENFIGTMNVAIGRNAGYRIQGSNNTILGAYQGTEADATLSDTVIISAGSESRLVINSNKVATFSGDVVVSSRGKQWMLVEQGGLCHMVQQVRATTADVADPEYPQLRDVFAELNVVEKALEEVMEKLRMTAPDGWPVWDGSDNSR